MDAPRQLVERDTARDGLAGERVQSSQNRGQASGPDSLPAWQTHEFGEHGPLERPQLSASIKLKGALLHFVLRPCSVSAPASPYAGTNFSVLVVFLFVVAIVFVRVRIAVALVLSGAVQRAIAI